MVYKVNELLNCRWDEWRKEGGEEWMERTGKMEGTEGGSEQ